MRYYFHPSLRAAFRTYEDAYSACLDAGLPTAEIRDALVIL